MAECANTSQEFGGGQDESKPSNGNYNGQRSVPLVYRVFFNNVPMTLTEGDVMQIVASVTDVKPKFTRFINWRQDTFGAGDANDKREKFCYIDFELDGPAYTLFEKLHQTPPHYLDLRVSIRDPSLYYGNRIQRGGFKKHYNNQNRQGNQQRYGQQSFYNQSYQNGYGHGGNNNNSYSKSPQHNNSFRGQNPAYMVNAEDSVAFPVYSSPPAALAAPMPALAFPADFSGQMAFPGPQPCLMLMGGNQYCYGCGAMTQSNCSTCFTPFCSPYCLGKLTNPSHPFECSSMLIAASSPQEAMKNLPTFGVWMQQQQPPYEVRRGKSYPRKNNNRFRGIEQKNVATAANGNPDEGTLDLEEGIKNVSLEKLTTPPPPAVVKSHTPPAPQTPIFSSPPEVKDAFQLMRRVTTPPRMEPSKSPETFVAKQNNNFAGMSPKAATPPSMPILEPFRSTPPQMINKMVPPPPPIMLPSSANMICAPGGGQPMFVLVPNHQMMMAPYYGDQMQPAPYLEQPQFEMSGLAGYNPQCPQGTQPQAFYWPNYQAY